MCGKTPEDCWRRGRANVAERKDQKGRDIFKQTKKVFPCTSAVQNATRQTPSRANVTLGPSLTRSQLAQTVAKPLSFIGVDPHAKPALPPDYVVHLAVVKKRLVLQPWRGKVINPVGHRSTQSKQNRGGRTRKEARPHLCKPAIAHQCWPVLEAARLQNHEIAKCEDRRSQNHPDLRRRRDPLNPREPHVEF